MPQPPFSSSELNIAPPAAFRIGGLHRLISLPEGPGMRALRYGVLMSLPLLLAGALGILINNFPLQTYQDAMNAAFGPSWKIPGNMLLTAGQHILALSVSFSLAYSFIARHNEEHPGSEVPSPIGMMVNFGCLVIMMNPVISDTGAITLEWGGIRGFFGTLVLTVAACRIFLYLCGLPSLRMRFYSEGADPALPGVFDSILPALGTLGVFIFLQCLCIFFGADSVFQTFYDLLRELFADAQSSFALGALYVFLVQVCWFLGIHGPDLLDPLTHAVFGAPQSAEVVAAFALHGGGEMPAHLFTKNFFDTFVYLGGSGATLGLLAAVFLRSRDNGTRRVAAMSLLPGVFNINELVIFGLPIVLNPAFLIPFLLVPLVLLAIAYAALSLGLVPPPVYPTFWTTPPLINAYIATDSWRGVALQAVNIGVAALIYMPFVRLGDQSKLDSRRKHYADLVRLAESGTRGPNGKRCTDRIGGIGALARSLAADMHYALEKDDGSIVLHYQPRVDYVNRCVPCVEALLRWEHPAYGTIPPVLVLAIAEDTGLASRLNEQVLHLVFARQKLWRNEGLFTTVSVNLSEAQLKNRQFPILLDALFSRYTMSVDAILFEVPEALALDPGARYLEALQAIRSTGAQIAVDDFGKGYQAISHLKRLPLSELQIDRALIKDVVANKSCQEVLLTIQELCQKLGIRTSAEFVESGEQLETLLELNFTNFQGHLFAHPLRPDDCAEFIKTYGKN